MCMCINKQILIHIYDRTHLFLAQKLFYIYRVGSKRR